MKRVLPFVLTCLFAAPVTAQTASEAPVSPAFEHVDEKNLSQFVWKKRPIIVFADSTADPRFTEQLELLQAQTAALEARDVVVLLDAAPDEASELRKKLRPRGFMLVLIGKDGGVKLRKPFPWDVREISRVIDKMPMRQREIREAKEAAASGG